VIRTTELAPLGRAPFDGGALFAFLGARAVPGVERFDGVTYRRSLALERGSAVLELTPHGEGVRCRLELERPADEVEARVRCRRLLDLDTDLTAVEAQLSRDPVLGPLVERRPGLRVPSTVDGFELAVRAVVGQQVSVAGARTVLGRLASRYGEPLAGTDGLNRHFPSPAALAGADPASLPFPRVRGEALRSLARLVIEGRLNLEPGADGATARASLLGIRGVGPWTASYIGMRALADPDAWLPGDVGLRSALQRLGHPSDDTAALQLSEGWRPWRSYAVIHLWATLQPAYADIVPRRS
jgi:AraC family transcriptional regulator, regulatory protein of adaptative response / DNA-3-methyladenine glycosylase II